MENDKLGIRLVVGGVMCRIEPAEDITALEAANLSIFTSYVLATFAAVKMSPRTELTETFIDDHGLRRHFRPEE